MKVFKKSIILLMTMAIVLASCPAVSNDVKVNAAGTVKVLNGKSKKIVVGDSSKIVVKNSTGSAVSYVSSSKKIAKVSKKGVVKGVKPGKATITVKAGTSKAKVTVTVLPKKVASVTAATTNASTSATVSWKAQKNVTGYEILASTKKNSGYKVVKTVKGANKKTATVTKLKEGATYYFKVRAYGKAGKKKVTGEASKVASVKLWKLVWSDEFNGTTLNMNNWTYEVGNGQDGWGNQEYENYTAGGNYKMQNGNLVIIPRAVVNTKTNKAEYTSTRIISRGKQQFKYGKIEIRAKATKAHGTWSAGWMLGTNGQIWPKNGEIDIFESMMGAVPQSIHCPYFNNQPSAKGGNKNGSAGITQKQSSEEYHTYGIIWTDTYIQFTLDGKNTWKYDPSLYNTTRMPLSETWNCFKSPFYFILNCAIGGNAAIEKNEDGTYKDIDFSTWKLVNTNGDVKTYEDYCYIDYVRVYQ